MGKTVPASDLYALGATLIHLLTGTAPADLPQRDLRIQFADRVSIDPNFTRWIEALTAPDLIADLAALDRHLNLLKQDTFSLLLAQPVVSLLIVKFCYRHLHTS